MVQTMAWCRPGDKPLSELTMGTLLTHIFIAWLQWVRRVSFCVNFIFCCEVIITAITLKWVHKPFIMEVYRYNFISCLTYWTQKGLSTRHWYHGHLSLFTFGWKISMDYSVHYWDSQWLCMLAKIISNWVINFIHAGVYVLLRMKYIYWFKMHFQTCSWKQV